MHGWHACMHGCRSIASLRPFLPPSSRFVPRNGPWQPESQKCSPAPVVHSTIDDLTPMKHAVERWKEYSDAHPGEDARPNENASDERAETSDSDDEFDSPGNHRGVLPTPRLRARVAIRLAHGPARKIPHGAYKCTTDEELRRRAKVMGLSTSPFSRH